MRNLTLVTGLCFVAMLCSPLAAQEAGDAAAGEKVFKRCLACHAVGPGAANKVGPELNGIVGEKPGIVEGYKFSPDLVTYGEGKVWNEANLTEWLTNPKAVVPKTKMIFPGIKKPDEMTNLITYLAGFDENGEPRDPAEALAQAAAGGQ
ncbi:cytochrome c family protein [Aureimonas fodinaquatilis]|uniref:Cytochrome c family protein n=1 Tax=Aureimonas fodinaquatilis TaxID=2565783 RepID=A0A5B0E3F0_9HYPH|nr:cytochrome c family protein [Aureimonas fodinaquatilis]KAA0972290.1 cytochrome c family protein [Aureimonas fodinaquatilis]